MELKEIEIFNSLDDREIEKIKKEGEILNIKNGETLISEGEEGDSLYIILEGSFSVSSKGNVIKILKKGEMIGEMAILLGGKRTATCKAIEDSVTFRMEKERFFSFTQRHPETGIKILKILSLRLKETTDKMLDEIRRDTALKTIGRLAGTVIHDLKSPITVIKGYLEFLEKDLSLEERKKIIDILKKEITKLLSMIQDFLEFARGKETLRPMKVNLKNYIEEIIQFMKEEASKKNIEIKMTGEGFSANIDPIKMKRVFTNIIQNSMEAMDKGLIEIILKDREIIFKDNGKGMTPEVKERIFEPFYTSKQSGTGLGMTIVKKIIDDHSGKISVESEEGKGTEIKVFLPLSN